MYDYDLNDPLGIHAALDALPEERWDEFFDDWLVITERAEFDVAKVTPIVLRLARERADQHGTGDALVVAWRSVSRSLLRYLAATRALPMPSPVGWIASNR
jgi:hypothetical protein